ncbi:hypothetical protein LEMLEM_LOCUS8171, partial [Lemmus lemmus]
HSLRIFVVVLGWSAKEDFANACRRYPCSCASVCPGELEEETETSSKIQGRHCLEPAKSQSELGT